MKSRFRIAAIAVGLATALLPAARAADETQPPPPPPAQAPATGADQAPDGARPARWRHRAMRQFEHLSESLNLTPEQQEQVKAIMKDNAPQREAILNDTKTALDAQRAKMQELRKGTEAKIRALLTPEQQQKFDAMPRPQMGWGPHSGGPKGPPPPPDGNPPPPPPSAP